MALKFLTVDLITGRIGDAAAAELSGETVGTTAYNDWATQQGELVEGRALGYVARRYNVDALDFSNDSTALQVFRAHLLDLVYVDIYGQRFKVPEVDQQRGERAEKYFGEIGEGKIAIPTKAEPEASPVPGIEAQVEGAERQFTPDSLKEL